MLWLTECPVFWDQGLVRPLVTASNKVILFCDEGDHVWCRPEDVTEDGPVEELTGPEWMACGEQLTPGTTRWATMDELESVGWDTLEWHDDPIDRDE